MKQSTYVLAEVAACCRGLQLMVWAEQAKARSGTLKRAPPPNQHDRVLTVLFNERLVVDDYRRVRRLNRDLLLWIRALILLDHHAMGSVSRIL